MKKKLLLSILGTAAASAFGQGFILLDNYDSYGPNVIYGPGVPANGVSGALGTIGTGFNSSWTAGIYFAVGTPSIIDPAGSGIPNEALALATGPGSTAQFDSANAPVLGEFLSPNGFNTGAAAGGTVTVELVAYDTAGGSYAQAAWRVHSAPFTMTTVSIISPIPSTVGEAMLAAGITELGIFNIPEPSTFALVGLGACLWMACGRRKNF